MNYQQSPNLVCLQYMKATSRAKKMRSRVTERSRSVMKSVTLERLLTTCDAADAGVGLHVDRLLGLFSSLLTPTSCPLANAATQIVNCLAPHNVINMTERHGSRQSQSQATSHQTKIMNTIRTTPQERSTFTCVDKSAAHSLEADFTSLV